MQLELEDILHVQRLQVQGTSVWQRITAVQILLCLL